MLKCCVHDLVRIHCAYTKVMCSVCVHYRGLFTSYGTMNCDAGASGSPARTPINIICMNNYNESI